jgi:hypothetical protein
MILRYFANEFRGYEIFMPLPEFFVTDLTPSAAGLITR